jgi:hypothetical protein
MTYLSLPPIVANPLPPFMKQLYFSRKVETATVGGFWQLLCPAGLESVGFDTSATDTCLAVQRRSVGEKLITYAASSDMHQTTRSLLAFLAPSAYEVLMRITAIVKVVNRWSSVGPSSPQNRQD